MDSPFTREIRTNPHDPLAATTFRAEEADGIVRATLTRIDIPFFSLVGFLIKFWFASLVAGVIIGIPLFIFWLLILSSLLAGLSIPR